LNKKSDNDAVSLFVDLKIQFKCRGRIDGNRFFESVLSRGLDRQCARPKKNAATGVTAFVKNFSLLNVVVQRKLVWMRTQPYRFGFRFPLVFDECLEKLFGEHIALEQKLMVLFKAGKGFLERSGHRGH
jgi:hypothetical protein